MRKKTMVLCLLLALALSLAGCGSAETEEALAAARAENAALAEEVAALMQQIDTLKKGKQHLQNQVDDAQIELEKARVEMGDLRDQLGTESYGFRSSFFHASGELMEPEYRLWYSDQEEYGHYQHYNSEMPYMTYPGGSLLEVVAAIHIIPRGEFEEIEEDTWMLAQWHGSDDATYPLFWVRQSELVPYTGETMTGLKKPVALKDLTGLDYPWEEAMGFFSISSVENGIATVHERAWRNETGVENLLFPDPEKFSYTYEKRVYVSPPAGWRGDAHEETNDASDASGGDADTTDAGAVPGRM